MQSQLSCPSHHSLHLHVQSHVVNLGTWQSHTLGVSTQRTQHLRRTEFDVQLLYTPCWMLPVQAGYDASSVPLNLHSLHHHATKPPERFENTTKPQAGSRSNRQATNTSMCSHYRHVVTNQFAATGSGGLWCQPSTLRPSLPASSATGCSRTFWRLVVPPGLPPEIPRGIPPEPPTELPHPPGALLLVAALHASAQILGPRELCMRLVPWMCQGEAWCIPMP